VINVRITPGFTMILIRGIAPTSPDRLSHSNARSEANGGDGGRRTRNAVHILGLMNTNSVMFRPSHFEHTIGRS